MELKWKNNRRSKGKLSKISANRKVWRKNIFRRIPREIIGLNFSQWLIDNEKSNFEVDNKPKEIIAESYAKETVYIFDASGKVKMWPSCDEDDEVTLQNILCGAVHEFYRLKEDLAFCIDLIGKIDHCESGYEIPFTYQDYVKETIYIVDSSGQMKKWPNFSADDKVTLQNVLYKGVVDFKYNLTCKNKTFISELKRKSGCEIFTYSYQNQYYHLIEPVKVQKTFACKLKTTLTKNKLRAHICKSTKSFFSAKNSNHEERLKLDTEKKLARYLI